MLVGWRRERGRGFDVHSIAGHARRRKTFLTFIFMPHPKDSRLGTKLYLRISLCCGAESSNLQT